MINTVELDYTVKVCTPRKNTRMAVRTGTTSGGFRCSRCQCAPTLGDNPQFQSACDEDRNARLRWLTLENGKAFHFQNLISAFHYAGRGVNIGYWRAADKTCCSKININWLLNSDPMKLETTLQKDKTNLHMHQGCEITQTAQIANIDTTDNRHVREVRLMNVTLGEIWD